MWVLPYCSFPLAEMTTMETSTMHLSKCLESPLNCKEIQPVHPKRDSLEKTLMLGGIRGRRRRGQQRISWLDGITDSMHMSLVNSGSW